MKNRTFHFRLSKCALLLVTIYSLGQLALAQATLAQAPLATDRNAIASQAAISGPRWLPTFGGLAGTDGDVLATAVFDDGSGPALFVAGDFGKAGGVVAANIAKWDGARWFGLDSGLDDAVHSLLVHDDGSGPALFAGGQFTMVDGTPSRGLAKWDGSTWSALGDGTNEVAGSVRAMASFDDGSGTALFAGGQFMTAGGVLVNRIAKWDGSTWTGLGSGMNNAVFTLATFDDGNGEALYAGGEFLSAGGISATRIARWDGSTWSALYTGANASVRSLCVFDDGTGDALYAGGDFAVAGNQLTSRVAKWNGTNWTALGGGLTGFAISLTVNTMTVFDDGTGDALFVGGEFYMAGGQSALATAKWNGSSWSALGDISGDLLRSVKTLGVFDDGNGERLIAGGHFDSASGRLTNNIACAENSEWEELKIGEHAIGGPSVAIRTQAVFDDGSGPALFVGGVFTKVGEQDISGIAKWDGENWSALGSGLSGGSAFGIYDIQVYDDGGGDALYVGGRFTMAGGQPANRIAKWDGTDWTPLATGLDDAVFALETFNDGHGEKLFVGGLFDNADGITAASIAKWDGVGWRSLGSGLPNSTNVQSLTVFDDGNGPDLYVGGIFSGAGSVDANSIARWDGMNWSALGAGISGGPKVVNSMTVFDDGNGPALFAGGIFSMAGGVPTNHLAKWDGSAWSSVGSAISFTSKAVRAFATFDDGTGSALYMAGTFENIGGTAAANIVRWDGTNWDALDSGLNAYALSLVTFDDGNGSALYAGGGFTAAEDSGDSYLAKWGTPASASLTSDIATLSLSTGGQQLLAMDGGATRAGWFYFMLGSVTGTTPGIEFGSGVILPLNYDVFFSLTLFKPGLGAFGNYRGTLDGSGQALADFNLPALMDPSLAGVEIRHAFLAGSNPDIPEFASNAVLVTLVL